MDSRIVLRPGARRGSCVEGQYQHLGQCLSSESSSSTITLAPKSRKRGLLVGISKTDGPFPELIAAHDDVYLMRDLLIDSYDYVSDDISILIDDGVASHVQPTRQNILLAIAELVKDVREGDSLFFHYCGHSTQVENARSRNTEEDGKDECLIPMDGEDMMIVDNDLHAALVAPLPAGAHLVAILDTCHSGSLLDLKHYRCNRVPVPWIWRGRRNSDEVRNNVVRRGAHLLTLSELQTRKTPTARAGFRTTRKSLNVMCELPAPAAPSRTGTMGSAHGRTSNGPLARLRTTASRTRTMSPPPADKENVKHGTARPVLPALSTLSKLTWILGEDDTRCDSPVAKFPCNGWCRNLDGHSTMHEREEEEVKADVISLASCKDSQISWDNEEGQSMTTLLVQILREDPKLTLKDVLIRISHATYSMALVRHGNAKAYKQQQKKFAAKISTEIARLARLESKNGSTTSLVTPKPRFSLLASSPTFPAPPKRSLFPKRVAHQIKRLNQLLNDAKTKSGVDLDNFQNPELASPRPLDLNRPWRM
ncbi:caspase domain-containing protein [Mycena maculata]|uniref:Caspase domain-containing protein n=1 Tax=Mycena maculata TaxID=230809 RepID=A0AAD7JKA9_9AGAR|nr:caspase domain-containing protein [Mycena maculata]